MMGVWSSRFHEGAEVAGHPLTPSLAWSGRRRLRPGLDIVGEERHMRL